ncbi:MAG: class I SAM-dependent methyltransferase, partial [Opitutae bacterium]|nr:class I SAM-dependent methyltransferase [Opitutae bacterium]
MMDKTKVKEFWDKRARKYQSLPFESIVNLEEDPENLQLKISLETEKVFNWLGNVEGLRVLDLGAGVGQWAFRLVEEGAKSVTAVEYSADLVEIGQREAKERKISNVEFIVSPAEDFIASNYYDVIFISGLFVYMGDDQADKLMNNISLACHSGTTVLLRDGTAIEGRFEINNRMSEHLQTEYSASYRTRQEYFEIFERNDFKL